MKHENFRDSDYKTLSYSSFHDIGWLYLIPTVVSVTAAMLCKEQGITVCGICAIYEIFVVQKVIFNLNCLDI